MVCEAAACNRNIEDGKIDDKSNRRFLMSFYQTHPSVFDHDEFKKLILIVKEKEREEMMRKTAKEKADEVHQVTVMGKDPADVQLGREPFSADLFSYATTTALSTASATSLTAPSLLVRYGRLESPSEAPEIAPPTEVNLSIAPLVVANPVASLAAVSTPSLPVVLSTAPRQRIKIYDGLAKATQALGDVFARVRAACSTGTDPSADDVALIKVAADSPSICAPLV